MGDIATLDLDDRFDVIAGLDIFEHVPPAKVAPIVRGLRRHLTPGGLIFANIPAFGVDPVFGEVFDVYLEEWRPCARAGVPFGLLHTDDCGFPLHGHITWADTTWWQRQFTDNGFVRRPDLERAAHDRYGEAFRRETPSPRRVLPAPIGLSRRSPSAPRCPGPPSVPRVGSPRASGPRIPGRSALRGRTPPSLWPSLTTLPSRPARRTATARCGIARTGQTARHAPVRPVGSSTSGSTASSSANLVRKELKVKYKNSALGFLWSLLNPMLYLVVFYVVFTVFLQTRRSRTSRSSCSPASCRGTSSRPASAAGRGSIVGNAGLVSKVWFPREILPLASIGAALVHFFLQLIVLFGALVVFRYEPSWSYLPLRDPDAASRCCCSSAALGDRAGRDQRVRARHAAPARARAAGVVLDDADRLPVRAGRSTAIGKPVALFLLTRSPRSSSRSSGRSGATTSSTSRSATAVKKTSALPDASQWWYLRNLGVVHRRSRSRSCSSRSGSSAGSRTTSPRRTDLMGAAIEIEHVSKHFQLNHERADSLKERVVNFRKAELRGVLGAAGRRPARGPGRDRRPARPQRVGQVDAAQVRRRHHAPDHRHRSVEARAGWPRCSSSAPASTATSPGARTST